MHPNQPLSNQTAQYPYQGPTIAIRRSKNRSVLYWVFGILFLFIACLLGLLILLMFGTSTGTVALGVAIGVAMLPVPLYITFILWLDRYESEPLWMLATCFIWGATFAAFLAIIFNTVGEAVIIAKTGNENLGDVVGALIFAPLSEESGKAMILFILFLWKKDEFDGVVDGFVYAGMVGLGFAMTENFAYYGRVIAARGFGSDEFNEIYKLRGMLAAYSHPLFTSMTGIALGLSRQIKSRNAFVQFIRVVLPLAGLGLAMFLHFLWNFIAVLSGDSLERFVQLYTVLMVPIFICTLIIIFIALLREGRTVREHLMCDLQRGLLSQEEYNRLCTMRGRMGASFRAFRKGGVGVWRARRKFHQIASELAFHRNRVARGYTRGDETPQEREAAYVQMLAQLRQRLGPH
jgi:RsiW-degrading membrane proteinase PrsW (M82 family)